MENQSTEWLVFLVMRRNVQFSSACLFTSSEAAGEKKGLTQNGGDRGDWTVVGSRRQVVLRPEDRGQEWYKGFEWKGRFE